MLPVKFDHNSCGSSRSKSKWTCELGHYSYECSKSKTLQTAKFCVQVPTELARPTLPGRCPIKHGGQAAAHVELPVAQGVGLPGQVSAGGRGAGGRRRRRCLGGHGPGQRARTC